MLHPQMVEMIEYAKSKGARVWLNTNGSMFGPTDKLRNKLERLLKAGIDLIEFSMDAADAQTYALLRPPRSGKPGNANQWWNKHVDNVRAALMLRKQYITTNRIVVSVIRQQAVEDKLDDVVQFWLKTVGVDEVITRKFLSWDDNTTIDLGKSADRHLYADLPTEKQEPCVWPFERLNVDTLGRIWFGGVFLFFVGFFSRSARIPFFKIPTTLPSRIFGRERRSIGIDRCI
jgi:MoaA/NifB/PqqE/SkfB family radical SAM enzyme